MKFLSKTQCQVEKMDLDGLIPYVGTGTCSSEIEAYEQDVDQILIKVNELEKRVIEVEQSCNDQSKKQPGISKGRTLGKDKRQISGPKKPRQDGCSREAKAANARTARKISNELHEADMHLEELREILISKCRKISTDEKRKIAAALDKLPVEDVDKALEIVAQYDPNFQSKGDLVDLDLDAQSERTLWRLKFFVKGALEVQGKSSTVDDADNNHDRSKDTDACNNSNKKRKKEIRNAIAKTTKNRSLKPSS